MDHLRKALVGSIKGIALVIVAASFSACTVLPPKYQALNQAIEMSDEPRTVAEAQSLANTGDPIGLYVLGIVYEFGASVPGYERNVTRALSLYTLSARYGQPHARSRLAQLGVRVPYPDLAQSAGYSGGVLPSLGEGLRAAGSAFQSRGPQMVCETRRNFAGNFETVCR